MALDFLNPSRSYDAVKRRVRFSGHDGMVEVPFTVDVDALPTVQAGAGGEDQYLAAFDATREAVRTVARKAYSRGRKTTYALTAADFR